MYGPFYDFDNSWFYELWYVYLYNQCHYIFGLNSSTILHYTRLFDLLGGPAGLWAVMQPPSRSTVVIASNRHALVKHQFNIDQCSL
jgi:hypothetical protein